MAFCCVQKISDDKAAGCWVRGEMVSEVGEEGGEEGLAGKKPIIVSYIVSGILQIVS